MTISIICTFVTSCNTTSSIEVDIDDLKSFINVAYPDYKILTENFDNHQIYSPFEKFTNSILGLYQSEERFIESYDLNNDNLGDFLVSLYKTAPYTDSSGRYDSTFQIITTIIFSSEANYYSLSKPLYKKESLFSGDLAFKVRFKYGIIDSGTYERGSPFFDSITLSQPSLVNYSSFYVGVTEFIGKDSLNSIAIYIQ